MCRGGESEPQSQVTQRQFDGKLVSAQQAAPQEQCSALPARALRARKSSHLSPPTWAAWLPKPSNQNVEVASTCSGSTSPSDLSCPWTMEAGYQQNVEVGLGDQSTTLPAEFTYDMINVNTDQQVVFVPMAVPVGEAYQFDLPFLVPMDPMENGVQLIPVENWADANSSGMYFSEPQASDCFVGQLEHAAGQAEFSMGPLTGKVWQLSKDSKGCRQVQDAFENAGCDEERTALASELVGHVWEALKCMNANHVLQKCITVLRPDVAQFVIDELTQHGGKGVVQAAKHRFGCRVLQRLLEHCSQEQISPMVEVLLNDAVDLSSHTYGHYVMMHLFEQCDQDVVSRLASTLQQHLPNMTADGYIGAVIGKALNHTNTKACVSLAAGLLQEHAHVVVMACSRWGYAAVKQALVLVSASEQDKACKELAHCSPKLRSSRYGRLVATFVVELQAKASA